MNNRAPKSNRIRLRVNVGTRLSPSARGECAGSAGRRASVFWHRRLNAQKYALTIAEEWLLSLASLQAPAIRLGETMNTGLSARAFCLVHFDD